MGTIIWLALIIYVVTKVVKQKNLEKLANQGNSRDTSIPREEKIKPVKSNETQWLWGEEQERKRKQEERTREVERNQRASKNSKSSNTPIHKKVAQEMGVFETTDRVTELDRQEAKAVIKEQKQLQKELLMEEKDYASLAMEQLEEVMVKGPNDRIENERDFVGEGLEMINRLV